MARLVLIKNIAEHQPSIANIVAVSVLGQLRIDRYDPDKTYNSGDKVFVVVDGELIVKECVGNNVIDFDNGNWVTVEGIFGSNSSEQQPNSYQQVSYFESKLAKDINTLTRRLNTLTNLDDEDLKNTFVIPLYEEEEITLTSGHFEFGRVFI